MIHSAVPDLRIVFPGRVILSDVAVLHSLSEYAIGCTEATASRSQGTKNRKYASVAARLGAELLNVCVGATGGMAKDALRLAQAVDDEGERWLRAWSSAGIQRHEIEAEVESTL